MVTGIRAVGTWMSFGHACMHTNIQKILQELLTGKECGPEKEQGKTPQGTKLSGRGQLGNQTSLPHAVEKYSFPVLCTQTYLLAASN